MKTCIFCGIENEDLATTCKNCGYVFEDAAVHKAADGDIKDECIIKESSGELTRGENDLLTNQSEHNNAENISKYKWREIPEIKEDPTIKVSEKKEILVAIIFYLMAIGIVAYGVMSRGTIEVIFDIEYEIALGIIGFIAFLVCGAFEGRFPGTIRGTVARTLIFIFVIEFPNFITIPLYLIVLGVSIVLFFHMCFGRLSGALLGSVSIIFLSFMGLFIAVAIGLFFREYTGGRKNNRRH